MATVPHLHLHLETWEMPTSTNNASHGRNGVYGRVIVHADLDCFYCQVEHVRLGIPMSTPLAVQQWDGLIAVNYEARKFGVKRGDRADAARQKCPQIMLVHVETISANPVDGTGDEAGQVGARPDKGACKVSLERYREASFAIMTIFQTHCRRVEKASIDEAYMDLTEEASRMCHEAEAGDAEDVAYTQETDLQGTTGHRVDPSNAFDRALLAGARLTATMRLAVEQELGFTVSAGIASNKVLAKLASSMNKPNKQTVVPAGASSEMLDTIPVRNMHGLGGKLGESVVSWSKADTASDLKRFSEEKLVGRFGPKTGEWLWRVCRGMDDEPVTPNLKPKSLSVCKSFAPVGERKAVLRWMTLLCKELAHRIRVDREAWSRRATKLTLHTISVDSGSRINQAGAAEQSRKNTSAARSRTVDIPCGRDPPTVEALVLGAMATFDKTEGALPCVRLALTAHDFACLATGRGSIASFLCASATSPFEAPSRSEGSAQTAREDFRESTGSSFELASDASGKGGVGNCVTTGMMRTINAQTGTSSSSRLASAGDKDSSRLPSVVGRSSPSPEAGKEQCPKCGEAFLSGDLQEHLDFHYAEGLQERYAREGDVAGDMAKLASASGGGAKRRRPEGRTAARRQTTQSRRSSSALLANRRIDNFFKPA